MSLAVGAKFESVSHSPSRKAGLSLPLARLGLGKLQSEVMGPNLAGPRNRGQGVYKLHEGGLSLKSCLGTRPLAWLQAVQSG